MSELQTDVENINRLLSRPNETPNEFGSWIVKWLAVNMDISTYQLRGLSAVFFKAAPVIGPHETRSEFSMGDMATVGPTLSGLANGTYLAFWGANVETPSGDVVGLMGISPNGATPSDTEVAKGRTIDDADNVPIVYSRSFTVTGNDANTLQAKYMRAPGSEGVPSFWNRWLVAVMTDRV